MNDVDAHAPLSLMDERFRLGRHCRWPVAEPEPGSHLLCAADVEAFGQVYCAAHRQLAGGRLATREARRAAAERFALDAPRESARRPAMFASCE